MIQCCTDECGAAATHVEPDGEGFHCARHAHLEDRPIDFYKLAASEIFRKPYNDVSRAERHVGKMRVLEAQAKPEITAAPCDHPPGEREAVPVLPNLELVCAECDEREPAPADAIIGEVFRCTHCGDFAAVELA